MSGSDMFFYEVVSFKLGFFCLVCFKYRERKKIMTHPLFVGTPVDDLPSELQWIIASYLPRHPVASLAWDMIIQFLTRTDRSWLYGSISQDDLYCTNLYF
jgi:hypothetical protein